MRESLAVARLTAAALTFRLAVAQADAKLVYEGFLSMSKNDGPPARFGDAVKILDALDIGSDAERIALIPLLHRCAYKLAGAHDRLRSSIRILNGFTSNMTALSNAESRKDMGNKAAFVLSELHELLLQTSQQCQLASLAYTNWRWPYKTEGK